MTPQMGAVGDGALVVSRLPHPPILNSIHSEKVSCQQIQNFRKSIAICFDVNTSLHIQFPLAEFTKLNKKHKIRVSNIRLVIKVHASIGVLRIYFNYNRDVLKTKIYNCKVFS